MTHDNDRTETITVEVTKDEGEFLEWAASLEGITPQEYLLKAAKGKLLKLARDAQTESKSGLALLSPLPGCLHGG